MEFLNEAIIAGIFTGLGLLISKATDFFKARRSETREDKKTEADIDKSEVEQAVGMYKDIIVGLREDMKQMLEHLHALENDHLKCREENAALRAEVKGLTERVNSLEGKKQPVA